MKFNSFLSKIYKVIFVNKNLKKIIITPLLSIITLVTIVNADLIRAEVIPLNIEDLIVGKKMTNMELGLKEEYEQYFGKTILPDNILDVNPASDSNQYRRRTKPESYSAGSQSEPYHIKTSNEMIRQLVTLDQQTGTKSAVMWVMPKQTHLHLVLLTASGKLVTKDIKNLPSSELAQTVKDFYLEINALNSPMDLTLAQQLHEWILTPFEAEILIPQKIDNILFCLGSGVRALPIAALHDGEKFAVQKYNMSRIPAFNLISTSYKSLRNPRVLAMGASDFTENDPLPGVTVELQNIVERLQNRSSEETEEILFNQEFTLPNMEQQLQANSFDIVHLATHADFNPGSPDNSYIQFWDEKLTLDKMSYFAWQTPPELLVLSACNTAIGDEEAELGFTGIALQTGVKSALGSLWYVSDFGTLALVTEFYEQLINQWDSNSTKTQALSTAQNLLLDGTVYFDNNRLVTPHGNIELPDNLSFDGRFDLSHPFYWASFTLISSPW